jgi:UDP-N-acetylmuramoyl-tripeptide--D-alanyl-D-alanine ligase
MKALFRRLVTRMLERRVRLLVAKNPDLHIVAVAGSVGKTSAKLAIATVLREKFRVLVHPGNYNSEISLPLSLFELSAPEHIMSASAWMGVFRQVDHAIDNPYPYDVVVVELATDHPGDIANFMKYLHPQIGVITAVAPEHMANFRDIDAVAEEEFTLARCSAKAIINGNDARLMELAGRYHIEAKVYGSDTHSNDALLGEHSRQVLSAAAAVGEELGMTTDQIEKGIAKVEPVPGRMQRLAGLNESVIIDDTYNSSPEAVLAALATLYDQKGRHIAVLGSMNELGEGSPSYHAQIGEAAAEVDLLVTIGEQANTHLGPAAVARGLDASHWHQFNSPYEAGNYLAPLLHKGDVVLVKGSQNGVFAEEAVKLLLAKPADAAKLVRQSPDWLDRKQRAVR